MSCRPSSIEKMNTTFLNEGAIFMNTKIHKVKQMNYWQYEAKLAEMQF